MPHRLPSSEVIHALYPVESAPLRRVRPEGAPAVIRRDRPLGFVPLQPIEEQQPDESHLWRALAIATPLFILFYVALGIAAHVMRARGLI